MEEEWSHIHEFPDYSISNLGRVRNENRGRILAPSQNKSGVLKVGLVRAGRQTAKSVKVLVANHFVFNPNPDMFDTPIILDGDQTNVIFSNLMWRPRWFAWKYHKQFSSIDNYLGTNSVKDAKTGLVYSDVAQACMVNGLLFKEVEYSAFNQVPVYPTWHHFEWADV